MNPLLAEFAALLGAGAGGGASLLLDLLPGAGVACSVRKLRTAYSGPCMRVRRSSDSAEMDVNFTGGGDLDTVAMLSWSGSDSVFVKTLYDQSGNAIDLTETTAANQPRIVNAGTVDTINGKPSLKFTAGSSTRLASGYATDVLTSTRNVTMAAIEKSDANNMGIVTFRRNQATFDFTNGYLLERRTGNLGNNLPNGDGGSSYIGYQAADTNTTALSMLHYIIQPGTGSQSFYVDRVAKTLSVAYSSGTGSVGNFMSSGAGLHRVIIGARSQSTTQSVFTDYLTGSISEVVAWPADLTANRAALEADQRTYFGTP